MLTTLLAVMLLFSFSQPMVFAADSGDIINSLTSNDENIIKRRRQGYRARFKNNDLDVDNIYSSCSYSINVHRT